MQIMGKSTSSFFLNCERLYWLIVLEFIVLMTLEKIRVKIVQTSKFDTILSVQMNCTKKETNGHLLCVILGSRNVFQQDCPHKPMDGLSRKNLRLIIKWPFFLILSGWNPIQDNDSNNNNDNNNDKDCLNWKFHFTFGRRFSSQFKKFY